MQTVEERLAFIEGRQQEHSRAMDDFRSMGERLDHRMDRLEHRIDALDLKLDSRLNALDQKLSRMFFWVASIQVTVVLAVFGVMVQLVR